VLPFRPSAPELGMQFLEDLDHGWASTHEAWNKGKYDSWVTAKGTTTMAHLTRADIPFHYALADAFTVCDAYYCSLLGPTDPNRFHMWTGWTGNDGKGGGPVLDDAELGYDWSTYPEVLRDAGISWKVYQDVGQGLDAAHAWGWGDDAFIGNFGDNSLLYFHQYQNAQPGNPLFEGARRGTEIARTGTLFDQLQADVTAGKLPQVSWIVAPESYSEHGNWPANFGAWYVSQVLDVLTSNPAVFGKTALFLMFDENDGQFDHLVPPTPPQSRAEGLSTIDTANEIFAGNAKFAPGPYGLGVRVPMVVISPWTKGGWVSSEVFDHTSLIRFIERRFGTHSNSSLREPNITPWRRAVVGDLTSVFDFRAPDDAKVTLPSTDAFFPPDENRHPDFRPPVPAQQAVPAQEPGQRPARPVPYELQATITATANAKVSLHFTNTGDAAAVFHVRSGNPAAGPWTYTVGAHDQLTDQLDFAALHATDFDISVYGPNGFFRAAKGSFADDRGNLSVHTEYDRARNAITIEIRNHGARLDRLHVADAYTSARSEHRLERGDRMIRHYELEHAHGWYDFTITGDELGLVHQVAGHVETGRDSMSDPAIGART
jgi:phospholipase C